MRWNVGEPIVDKTTDTVCSAACLQACVRSCLFRCLHIFIYLNCARSSVRFRFFFFFFGKFFFHFGFSWTAHSIATRRTHTHFAIDVRRIYSILWASHKILMARQWPMDVIIHYIVLCRFTRRGPEKPYLTVGVHAIGKTEAKWSEQTLEWS